MDRDLVSIGKEPLLLSPPIYSDKKRESSVVGYSIINIKKILSLAYFRLKSLKISNKKFFSEGSRRPPPKLFFLSFYKRKFTVTIYNYPQLLTMINYDKHD